MCLTKPACPVLVTSSWRTFDRAFLGQEQVQEKTRGVGRVTGLLYWDMDWALVVLYSWAFDELLLNESEKWNWNVLLRQPEPRAGSCREEKVLEMALSSVCSSLSVFQPKPRGMLVLSFDSGHSQPLHPQVGL